MEKKNFFEKNFLTKKSSKNVFFEQKIRKNAYHFELLWNRELVNSSKFFKKITEDDPKKNFYQKKFFWPKKSKKSIFEQKISKNLCHDELFWDIKLVDGSKFFKKNHWTWCNKNFFRKNFFGQKKTKCDFWPKKAKNSTIFEFSNIFFRNRFRIVQNAF